ncbi:serpin family protein [Nocardioides speluncae]|uniref:serpin family protein n=1 Tax=Nocardioides speluncae TaxID=2670337 RepID=UPI0019807C7F|nr:serpin family protein [Nocardioides speluncae]
MDDAIVTAIRRLTADWVTALAPTGSTALSAVGAWPLLALLAHTADGPARAELAAAVGLEPEQAGAAAVRLLAELDGTDDLSAALGIWTGKQLELRDEFAALVPKAHRGVLAGDQETDRAALDAWARERTRGLIEQMPVGISDDTRLVLATALALTTEWQQPFNEGSRDLGGSGRPWLSRTDTDLDSVRVVDGSLSLLRVAGTGPVDVLLAIGEPDAAPAGVLLAALAAGPDSGIPGSALNADEPGPGLRTVPGRAYAPPLLFVGLPAYEVRSTHDLLAHDDLFGLTSAQDSSRGHFPGISADPLAISQAGQATVARFHATGFEAASVTMMAMAVSGMPPPPQRIRNLHLTLDRPFGFIAVQRESGLPLFAGWSAEDSWVLVS